MGQNIFVLGRLQAPACARLLVLLSKCQIAIRTPPAVGPRNLRQLFETHSLYAVLRVAS